MPATARRRRASSPGRSRAAQPRPRALPCLGGPRTLRGRAQHRGVLHPRRPDRLVREPHPDPHRRRSAHARRHLRHRRARHRRWAAHRDVAERRLLTPEVAQRMHDVGIARVSISIDFPTADEHDRFRVCPGRTTGPCGASATAWTPASRCRSTAPSPSSTPTTFPTC